MGIILLTKQHIIMSIDLSQLYTFLGEIKASQDAILDRTTALENRLMCVEKSVVAIHNFHKKKENSKKIKRLNHKSFHSNENNERTQDTTLSLVLIKELISYDLTTNHVLMVFFSSLEFTFCIGLLEAICQKAGVPTGFSNCIYEEMEFCDNQYHLDIETHLLRVRGWLEDNPHYKKAIPFKKNKRSSSPSNRLLGYYEDEWCSSSYKPKLLRLYEAFCIKIIKQFGIWQNTHSDEIAQNKLPHNLEYSECVLKIMGRVGDTKTLVKICYYLFNMC